MASFQQVKEYVTGVLKGLFLNKTILDKLGEYKGNLVYEGRPIVPEYTENEIQKMIEEIWAEFDKNHPNIAYPGMPDTPQGLTSNFITSDNKMIVTNDSKIFMAKK